nr:polysaccharide pyruvyl transferase family protein [Rhodobaculum claviforme]
MHSLIGERTYQLGRDVDWTGASVRRLCRAVVIPSANFLRDGFDMGGVTGFLEKLELPFVMVGLGAQAPDYATRSFDFHPSVLRLIDLIRERAPMVGVRGDFTAQVLADHGVHNVVVTGCPSNFINPDPDVGQRIAAKYARARAGLQGGDGLLDSFITHGDEPWPKDPVKQQVEKRLVAWTNAGPGMMVQQSVPVFMEYIRRANIAAPADIPEHREPALARALLPDATVREFRVFVAAKLRSYFSVHQWMEDSARYDFSVGMRLHGNMVAWQAGTPALWVHHDSRTRELAEAMALPTLPVDRFLAECASVEDAFARAEFDADAYGARRRELGLRLLQVFDSIEMTPAGYLAGLRMPAPTDTVPHASPSRSA